MEGLHVLQKKFVRLATYIDEIIYSGDIPTFHPSLPLFHQLRIINIYDIFKVQLGSFIFESINNIGPSHTIIQYTQMKKNHEHRGRKNSRENLAFPGKFPSFPGKFPGKWPEKFPGKFPGNFLGNRAPANLPAKCRQVFAP